MMCTSGDDRAIPHGVAYRGPCRHGVRARRAPPHSSAFIRLQGGDREPSNECVDLGAGDREPHLPVQLLMSSSKSRPAMNCARASVASAASSSSYPLAAVAVQVALLATVLRH